eukprot:TRINITY_DN782187_c0_g1_i1.p2 TRINITY_DN782187_c0_g1~~TRINITY_DN782187_c0_g1_i1.p2  ORF type:complete len:109 (-),score=17.66 TRINITY_DN782187_c0_g1_i1:28-354(-)
MLRLLYVLYCLLFGFGSHLLDYNDRCWNPSSNIINVFKSHSNCSRLDILDHGNDCIGREVFKAVREDAAMEKVKRELKNQKKEDQPLFNVTSKHLKNNRTFGSYFGSQ